MYFLWILKVHELINVRTSVSRKISHRLKVFSNNSILSPLNLSHQNIVHGSILQQQQLKVPVFGSFFLIIRSLRLLSSALDRWCAAAVARTGYWANWGDHQVTAVVPYVEKVAQILERRAVKGHSIPWIGVWAQGWHNFRGRFTTPRIVSSPDNDYLQPLLPSQKEKH